MLEQPRGSFPEINYGLQLQFRRCPELTKATVTALGGIPRELIHHGAIAVTVLNFGGVT